MTYSYSNTHASTFTRAQARRPASKVAADLKRMQRHYRQPSDGMILEFEQELVEYISQNYLASVEYGFQKSDGSRVVSLLYQVDLSGNLVDDRSGGVPVGVDISDASWFSFLKHNWRWGEATSDEMSSFREKLPFQRRLGSGPKDGAGYWEEDRSYSHTGSGVRRKVFRPHSNLK